MGIELLRVALVLLLLLAVSSLPSTSHAASASGTIQNGLAVSASTALTGPGQTPFNYIVIIMMENRPLNVSSCCGGANGIIGNTQAPYITSLARNYSLGENYFGVVPGSLPNYLAATAGTTFNNTAYNSCVSNDAQPTSCILPGPNIVDRIESSGRSWKAYMEDYTGGCFGTNIAGGAYDYFHNPFPYYTDIQNNTARCARIVSANPGHVGLPDSTLLADLNSASSSPNYLWLTPNEYGNMHGYPDGPGSISTGDVYLSQLVPQILNSTVFRTQNAALFITWDEPTFCSCPVPAIWTGPVVRQRYLSVVPYTHFSLLSTLEAGWNMSSLTPYDSAAAPMTEFLNPSSGSRFGLYNSGSLAVVQGGSAYNTISTRILGPEQVLSPSLSCGGLPTGGSCGFDPTNYSCSTTCLSKLKVSTSSSTPLGSYLVTVVGSDGVRFNSTRFALSVLAPSQLLGDVNGDCTVNIFDLAEVARVFGSPVGPGTNPHTDLTLDGRIDVADLVLVASNMGRTCQ